MNILKCEKCSGRNFLDRSTLLDEKLDLVCINCGNRKYIEVNGPTGRIIMRLEKARAKVIGVSWDVYSVVNEG